MNQISSFLISFQVWLFYVVLLSKRSSAEHYQYRACYESQNCGHGPNITFPFYIPTLQESYCGYPGFAVDCENGFPTLGLSENGYIIDHIFYHNRSVRVINTALFNSSDNCSIPRIIRNTTLRGTGFDYVNETGLHLFANCTSSWSERYNNVLGCGGSIQGGDDWSVALYDGDDNLTSAAEECGINVVAPVDRPEDDESIDGIGAAFDVLRRGVVLNWTASECSVCEESGGRCGFNATIFHFRCFCTDRPHSRSCKDDRNWTTVILASAISGTAVLVICMAAAFIFWLRRRKIKNAYLISRDISSDPSSKSDLDGGGSFYYGIPIFCYNELEEATNNFDPSKELGDGGFGTVYHGILKDGREVAIKRLYEHNYKRVEQFMNEIKILTCLKHRNLVNLYGCTSRRSRELLLVYEYIPNGTVADHLHGEKAKEAPLTWGVRMNIAIETASALTYLHKSDIVHRDVKTNNILLDSNFCVKVADFGLSRLFPTDVTHISTAPQGTPGYVDPEYHQCYQLTDKSDVYSFGVVMIELISSMPAVDITRHRHEINLANLAINRIQSRNFDELIDSSLGYKNDPEVLRMTTSVAELAFQCLQLEKDMRPSMDEVVCFLRDIQKGAGKIPPPLETDDVELLKKKNLPASPTAVTDVWIYSGSTTSSSVG